MLTADFIKQHTFTLTAGLVSALAYAYLAIHSQYYGDLNLIEFLSVSFFCAAITFGLWAHCHYQSIDLSPLLVISFAIIFRAIGLTAFPILEDDVYRYLWDAHMTFEQGTPYSIAPSSFFDAQLSERFETILGLINYPDIATVYGPVTQIVFALAYLISPGDIWPLQLIFAMADLGIIWVLLKLAKPNFVLLYAWCPLIIKEFAFTAHPDVLGAFFLVLAYLQYQRRQFVWLGILLALAAGVKIFAIITLPFLLALQWRGWLAFTLSTPLVALPFVTSDVSIVDIWLPEGLRAMSSDWLFNAPIYALFLPFASVSSIKAILLVCLAIGCGLYLYKALKNWPLSQPRIDLLFLALMVCLPALNPWYLVWLLPFAVLQPSVWAWVASFSLLISYASGINLNQSNLEPYEIPTWILIIEFGLIALAAAVGQRLKETLS